MKCDSRYPRRSHCSFLLVLQGALLVGHATAANPPAIHPNQSTCTGSPGHLTYVLKSKEYLENGHLSRGEIFDTLVCIASSSQSPAREGSAAVGALFALAEGDDQRRRRLLEIVVNPATESGVHGSACQLLTIVADASVAPVLFDELLKNVGGAKRANYAKALVDLGYLPYADWLEGTNGQVGNVTLPMSLIQREVSAIRVQGNPDELLNQSSSADIAFDRLWLVKQAFRHGLDSGDIEQAVHSYCGLLSDLPRRKSADRTFVRQCVALGIIDGDGEFSSLVEDSLENAAIACGTRRWPSWAEATIKAREREFWKLPGHSGRE